MRPFPIPLVAAGTAMTFFAAGLAAHCEFAHSEKPGVVYLIGHYWHLSNVAMAAAASGGACLGAGLGRIWRRVRIAAAGRGFEVISVSHGESGRPPS